MDFPELAKLAFSRVQEMEPHNVAKILGCILLREPDEAEMVHLAYGSDAMVHAKINDAKATLAAIYARCSAASAAAHHHQIGAAHRAAAGYHPHPAAAGAVRHHHFSPSAAAAYGFQYWPPEHSPPVPKAAAQQDFAFVDPAAGEGHYAMQQQQNLDDHHHYDAAAGGYYYTAGGGGGEDAFHINGSGGGGMPARAAARRASGMSTRRPCHYFVKGVCRNGQNCNYPHHHQAYSSDGFSDDGSYHNGGGTPGGLEKLEMEITELLNSRHGQPLSIASLPTLYGERYGKGLQAEGYLTESQRHGKAGYSLTKLLSRLNKIRHSVVLAEDAARYTEFRGERGGGSDVGSIYLTFPAESTFVEEDVATYFGIPCQERRMFGFVSFQNPETVSTILMRQKRERLIELERKRFAGVRLEPLPHQFAYFDCSIEDVNPLNNCLPADTKDVELMDRPLTVPDSLEVVSTSAPQTQASNNYDDKERYKY
nr:unnamed protein product [Digitaria exilis]